MDEVTLQELARMMARIEDKLDENISDHEARLRALERKMWVGIGTVGGLSSLSTILGILAFFQSS